MIGIEEVRIKSKRKNDVKNRLLFPFAARVSIYFSWLFINARWSPNLVTFVFFILGIVGGVLAGSDSVYMVVLSYLLYRLHIVLDVADGEVARFTQLYSIRGGYLDYTAHCVIYPLYWMQMSIWAISGSERGLSIYIVALGVLVLGLEQSIKSNYFRALYESKRDVVGAVREEYKGSYTVLLLRNIILDLLGFEGLLLGYLLCRLLEFDFYPELFVLFLVLIGAKNFIKFLLLYFRGSYKARN